MVTLSGNSGKQPRSFVLGEKRDCSFHGMKLKRGEEGVMPRFYVACHTCGRSGYVVSLSFFLLTLFFMAPVFATAPPVPEHGTADGQSALTPPSAPENLTVGEGAIKGDSKSKLYYLPSCPEYGW